MPLKVKKRRVKRCFGCGYFYIWDRGASPYCTEECKKKHKKSIRHPLIRAWQEILYYGRGI